MVTCSVFTPSCAKRRWRWRWRGVRHGYAGRTVATPRVAAIVPPLLVVGPRSV